MKAQERQMYVVLTNEAGTIICALCKYAEGGGCGVMPECKHPLEVVRDIGDCADGIEPEQDCWGFRPVHDRETCVDMVGCWIKGKLAELVEL